MKIKYFAVLSFLFCFAVSWSAEPAPDTSAQLLQTKPFEVRRLIPREGGDFFLSAVLASPVRERINVYAILAGHEGAFDSPTGWGYEDLSLAVFDYIVQGWKDWRQAANAFLEPAYQLPQLSFVLYDAAAFSSRGVQNPTEADLVLQMAVGQGGWPDSQDLPRGMAQSLFTPDGGGMGALQFFVEQAWFDWLNASPQLSEEEQKAVEEQYQRAVAEVLTFAQQAPAAAQPAAKAAPLSAQGQSFYQQLGKEPVSSWQKRGPWASYNQHIITHEMGHLMGLPHAASESSSVMSASVPWPLKVSRPSAQDGMRLARLVCWYYNQRAGETVCVPRMPQKTAASSKTAPKTPQKSAPRAAQPAAARTPAQPAAAPLGR